ncbi:hypothetical protein HGO40_23360 [Pseudomonas sp. CG7]|uniref:hypothetical protein n=1 Tax=Pseudomonas sp. CG7 TaxID=191007 RepID=UPI00203428ED|nr:hypothetical protein [Pseudomonas sp. CG7]MCM2463371.1 hypothetical protein [Pseudomonas sp. CG7]
MEKMLALLLGFSFLTGCQSMRPQTLGELSSGYTYIPVDPFSVQTVPGDSCKKEELHSNFPVEKGFLLDGKPVYREITGSLPDNSVRMLVEQFDSKGNVSYGAGKVGGKAESYRVTVDYINADTVNQEFWISKTMLTREGKRVEVPLAELPSFFRYTSGSEQYRVSRADPGDSGYTKYNVPIYVGVGLRAIADVRVLESKANISGIGVIGAEAEDKRLSGTLIVQTLGVSGKSITGALPVQSELNRTTAQNAIVAVASIKTLLYSSDVGKYPRVVGLYIPFPGGKPLVNALISELSQKRVEWPRPCDWYDETSNKKIL